MKLEQEYEKQIVRLRTATYNVTGVRLTRDQAEMILTRVAVGYGEEIEPIDDDEALDWIPARGEA